jgi:prepilin peptidase CpaA
MSIPFILEIAAFVCFAALIGAAVSDFRTREIGDRYPIGLGLGFLAVAPFSGLGLTELGAHTLAGLGVLGLGFALFALGYMGGADGKLAAACALVLGPAATPYFLTLTAALGGALALATLIFRAVPLPQGLRGARWARLLHAPGRGIPYGVAVSAAAIATLPRAPWLGG